MTSHTTPPVLRMEGITKHFPGVLANDQVSFDVLPGEVHALLGENGAGKSTLMKILYGLHRPDSGEIFINGERVDIGSPRAAVDHGIGMVHQHFMLVPNLSAVENAVLGLPSRRPPLLDLEAARARLAELSADYRLDVDPLAPVWQLPVGAQQRLEILKALFREARVLVLDEPTAVLAPAEVDQLFRIIRLLASQGRGIVFISHKLEEVKAISDRITVLRAGRVVGTLPTAEASASHLAQMMVGRPISLERRGPPVAGGEPVLRIDQVGCLSDRGVPALRGVSLTVCQGEIVGVAGVDGNGQRELAECIAGLRRPTAGSVTIAGVPVRGVVRDPALLGFIPEDRHRTGLILDFDVAENLVLRTFADPPYAQRRFKILDWQRIVEHARAMIRRYDIRAAGPRVRVSTLSGGNQQRVVVARETADDPALLVAAQATRGLDVGAVEGVHQLLREQRDRGSAVLYICTELSELLALCDRIVVLFEGEIMGEVAPEETQLGAIGEMMMGTRASGIAAERAA
jgi:simple sugar transport system ATP-binding protein